MIVYRRFLTITLTWKSSCVIPNYNLKTSKIYLFKLVISYFEDFEADTGFIIMFTCASRCYSQSTPLSRVFPIFIRE